MSVEGLIRDAYGRFNRGAQDPSDERELASLDFWHPDGVYVNDANDPDPVSTRGSRR